MPQLEFATYAAQIFWLAVIFGLLYFYLSKVSLPVIREVLHNRQSRISGDLKKAETLKKEAEEAEEDFTSVITNARQKASKILSDAKTKIDAEEASRNAKMEQNFAHQTKEAEHRMVLLKEKAVTAFIPIAAEAALMMSEKLLGKKIADLGHAEKIAANISKENPL